MTFGLSKKKRKLYLGLSPASSYACAANVKTSKPVQDQCPNILAKMFRLEEKERDTVLFAQPLYRTIIIS